MPFNIENFRKNIEKYGYADNNSYSVLVQTPPILGGSSTNPERMSFRIDQIRVPGISLQTADINRYGIGPTQRQPLNAQFQEVSMSVLGDRECQFWQFWYEWTRAIFQFNGAGSGNQVPNYTTEYKDQYASTIVIFIYDHEGRPVQQVNLFEAYPTAIRDFPLAWGDPGLLKINVSLIYTEYTIQRIGPNTPINNVPTRATATRTVVIPNS